MRKLILPFLIFILLISLTGCATTYGNFTAATSSINQQMATDTANQLSDLYPPAMTKFNIEQPINDAFGTSLIQQLRLKGYAVDLVKTQTENTNTQLHWQGGTQYNLSYVVDVTDNNNLYRVTVWVGQQSLSQVFKPAMNGKIYSAGSWAHKE